MNAGCLCNRVSSLDSRQRTQQQTITASARRLSALACAWLVLTQAADAAEMIRDSVSEEVLRYFALHLNTLIMALWIFVLGSCIGSFLNVVIYRMPVGMALSHPGSRCPVCETELSARDNIPILGWLSLRGRCRHCQVVIPSRYPLIEFTVGLLFLTVLLVETSTGAANLPVRLPVTIYGGAMDAIFQQGHWDLLGYFLAHTFYLTVTLAVCMIGLDGHTTPQKLIRIGVLVALITGTLWSELRPVHLVVPMPESLIQSWGANWNLPQWSGGHNITTGISLVGILDGIAGLASGGLTGWLAARTVNKHSSIASTIQCVFILAGVFCGWQMTWPILMLVLFAICLLKPFSAKTQQSTLPLILFGICCMLIFDWSRMLNGITLIRYDGWRWTGSSAGIDWVVTVVVTAGIALLISRTTHDAPASEQQDQGEQADVG